MEKLLVQAEELDSAIDEVLPLLITDDWPQAAEKFPQMIELLNPFLQEIMQRWPREAPPELVKSLLTRFLYAMREGDSIQLADILAYEAGRLLQLVYRECGKVWDPEQ